MSERDDEVTPTQSPDGASDEAAETPEIRDGEPTETIDEGVVEPPVEEESTEPEPPLVDVEPAGEHSVEDEKAADDAANDERVRREMARMTRRGFFWAAVAAGATVGGWKWLNSRDEIGRLAWPYRRVLETNEKIASAYFDPGHTTREWPLEKRDPRPRVNGRYGLDPNADHADWRLRIEGLESGSPVELTLDDIRRLPKHEMVTEFRCIEGWSMFVHWGGARLADLVAAYPPATRDGSPSDPANHPEKLVRYVAMETPGRGYYVGLDMPSALHPQTLLAYEINGQPLTNLHGAPLRLAIPVKYGIKNIKRIALIRYADARPGDFWGDRKYDWYAGL